MGTLAISSANLNTLENNILVLNDNINSVTGEIININGQINTVNEDVSNMKKSVSSLEEEIKNFMSEIRGTTIVANAQNDILLKQNELNKKYGNFDTIRNNIMGLLESVNMNLVSKKTLSTESQKVLMVAPNYFLSYALIAISCWFNNDRNGATKALNQALKLNDKKTSLLMGFVHAKLGRVATSYKWFKRYLNSINTSLVDNDFTILLDAYSEGLLDSSINDLIKEKISLAINNDNAAAKNLAVSRFSDFFKSKKDVKIDEYYYISEFTNNSLKLKEALINSRYYFDAFFEFDKLVSNNKNENTKTLNTIIKTLIESYEKEELLLRQAILKDDLIIKYNGDSQKVERDFKNSKLAYSMENDIYTIFTNILLENDKSSYALKKMAVSYLKDTIKKGLDDALPTGNIGTTEISINDYTGYTENGDNENKLIEDMLVVVRKPFDQKIKNVFKPSLGMFVGIAFFIIGIVIAFEVSNFIGLGISFLSICYLIYLVFNMLDRKKIYEEEYADAAKKYKITLENILAEIVDINVSVKRAENNYKYIVDYLNSYEVK